MTEDYESQGVEEYFQGCMYFIFFDCLLIFRSFQVWSEGKGIISKFKTDNKHPDKAIRVKGQCRCRGFLSAYTSFQKTTSLKLILLIFILLSLLKLLKIYTLLVSAGTVERATIIRSVTVDNVITAVYRIEHITATWPLLKVYLLLWLFFL